MFSNDPDPDWFDPELAELEKLSNGALDLIEIGRFDEAERIYWIERSALLHAACGQTKQAIKHYEQCLAHIDRYPDGFDSDSRACCRNRIDRLRQHSDSASSE